ncbi:MAG: T3SS (YopN, CesT) and YbjN peptide-binding chaperone 1 [Angustibacter sp.]
MVVLVPASEDAPEEVPLTLRELVVHLLADASHQPTIDSDGDVAFQVGGHQLFARCVEGEIVVLRVFGQWSLAGLGHQDPQHLFQICNEVTGRLSVAKATIDEDVLVVSAENVISDGADVDVVMSASVDLVLAAVEYAHELAHQLGGGETERSAIGGRHRG